MLKDGRMRIILQRRDVVGPIHESSRVWHSEALTFGVFKEE